MAGFLLGPLNAMLMPCWCHVEIATLWQSPSKTPQFMGVVIVNTMTTHCFSPTFDFRWNTFSMILRRNIMIRIIFPFYPSQNHWKGMVDHHFSSIFNRSWSPKITTWGTCPTRTGASWASFIAGFGRRCCGTINGVASCWMDFRMSPSEMRPGLQPVDWSGGGECWCYDVHIDP